MFKTTLALLSLAAALLPAQTSSSSQAGPVAGPTSQPDFVYATGGLAMPGAAGGAIAVVAHEFSFNSGKTVTGAPYSAEQITEHVLVLADGNRIVNTTTTKLYRDSQGRTRSETTLPALTGGPTPPAMVTISDPVAGVTYLLNSDNKTAQKLLLAKPLDAAKVKGLAPLPTLLPSGAEMGGRIVVRTSASLPKPDVKTEDLGSQEIDGVVATGKRIIETIPAGAIGNEQPIETVSERWFSPELQIVVKAVNTDPRMGQTTETFNSLNRAEPDASLFQVPADYTVVDRPQPQVLGSVTLKQPQ